MHYVIGDIHGCYDEFTILRKKIEKKDPDAVIILTGDLIDRGPKVWDMLRWAMKNITEDGKYQCICGNHEDMIISWYYDWLAWYSQENRKAYARPKTTYGFDEVLRENGCDTPEKIQPIIEFFQALPFRKAVYVQAADGGEILFDIVHGADSFEEGIDEEYRRELNLWGRDGSFVDDRTIVVHGHTPTMCYDYLIMDTQVNRPGMIGYQKQDINLDGGCCFSDITNSPCFLCAICLETMEEIYPRTIWNQLLRQANFTRTRKEAMQAEREYLMRYPWRENMHRWIMLDMLGIEEREIDQEEELEEALEESFAEPLEEFEEGIAEELPEEAEVLENTAEAVTEPVEEAVRKAAGELEPKEAAESAQALEPEPKEAVKPETEKKPGAKKEAAKAETEKKPEAKKEAAKAETEKKPEAKKEAEKAKAAEPEKKPEAKKEAEKAKAAEPEKKPEAKKEAAKAEAEKKPEAKKEAEKAKAAEPEKKPEAKKEAAKAETEKKPEEKKEAAKAEAEKKPEAKKEAEKAKAAEAEKKPEAKKEAEKAKAAEPEKKPEAKKEAAKAEAEEKPEATAESAKKNAPKAQTGTKSTGKKKKNSGAKSKQKKK